MATKRSFADQQLNELFKLVNEKATQLTEVAILQEQQLDRLEETSDAFAERLRMAETLAGLGAFKSLLTRPPPKKDLQLPKIIQLDAGESRVRLIPQRAPVDFMRLPKPRPPVIVKKRANAMQPGWGVHPLEQQKRPANAERQNEKPLTSEVPELLLRGSREGRLKETVTQPESKSIVTKEAPPKKPPPPPRRGSMESVTSQTSQPTDPQPEVADVKSAVKAPPPRRTSVEKVEQEEQSAKAIEESSGQIPPTESPGEAVADTAVVKPRPPRGPPPRRASIEPKPPPPPKRDSDDAIDKPKPPPPPKRSSAEDVLEESKPKPPPPPKRSSAEDVFEESKPKPLPPPKRSSAEEILVESKPKPLPPRRDSTGEVAVGEINPKAPLIAKQTVTADVVEDQIPPPRKADEGARAKSSGGLAARQAMLAGMLGGGPKAPPAEAPSGDRVESGGGGMPSKMALPPREELKKPKSLSDDAGLATAASELQKKLMTAPPAGKKDLSKYEKMKKAGLPQGAIEHAMIKDGLDPTLMFS